MQEINGMFVTEVQKDMNIDGTLLKIVARRVGKEEWQLYVENQHRIRSNWFEFFTDPESAIQEAVKAIEEEGVESFTKTEGFEYLFGED